MPRMNVELEGTLNPDGTLSLDEKIDLPPGRVSISIESTEPPPPLTPEEIAKGRASMESIWAAQKARGHVPRSEEELQELRQEAEERLRQFERDHLEADVEKLSSLSRD